MQECGNIIKQIGIIFIGSLLGLIMAILFAFGFAPGINLVFIATAVIGLIFSLVLITIAFNHRRSRCIGEYLPLTLFSSLSLLVLSVLSLSTVVTPGFWGFILLVFLGATAFFISIISMFVLVYCRVELRNKYY